MTDSIIMARIGVSMVYKHTQVIQVFYLYKFKNRLIWKKNNKKENKVKCPIMVFSFVMFPTGNIPGNLRVIFEKSGKNVK